MKCCGRLTFGLTYWQVGPAEGTSFRHLPGGAGGPRRGRTPRLAYPSRSDARADFQTPETLSFPPSRSSGVSFLSPESFHPISICFRTLLIKQ